MTDNTQAELRHDWQPTTNTMAVFKCTNCCLVGFDPHPLPEYGCEVAQPSLDAIVFDHRYTSKNSLKKAITAYTNKQIEEVLDRLVRQGTAGIGLMGDTYIPLSAIQAERTKLKESK